MKIAIQGEPGAFSHEAALALIPGAVIVPCPVSADVFKALAGGSVDAAVIPIENSLAGSVLEHFDLLLSHDVRVVRESLLRIRHNLIAMSGIAMGELDRVYFASGRAGPVPAIPGRAPEDAAARVLRHRRQREALVESRDSSSGAIASEAAAHYYGAEILEAGH